MGGAGTAILFMVSLVGLTIVSLIYAICVAHYFLTTICDSSAGHDEVHYPRESLVEWWWKPIFCLWILSAWVIPLTVLLSPLGLHSPIAFAITWVALLWLLYPLSLLSALYSQSWFFFMHPVLVWRMLRRYGAFAYVHLLTLSSGLVCAALLFGAFTQTFLWAVPAAFVIPTAILFYARHWGRFAWLSLNFVPRKAKSSRPRIKPPNEANRLGSDAVPEMDVQEIDPADEGIREGLPPGHAHGILAGVPVAAGGFIAGPPPSPSYQVEEEEWATEKTPYLIDPTQPSFQETVNPPLVPLATLATPLPAQVEEEDEWATNKKPYVMIGDGDFSKSPPMESAEHRSEADKPLAVSRYYDDRHRREAAEKRKAKAEASPFGMPAPSKKTPTFADALFFGVWSFMIYGRTLTVWANLVILTMVELFFLYLVKTFFGGLGV